MIQQSDGSEEIRWTRRANRKQSRQLIEELLKKEEDRRIQIWMCVHLGGERLIDVAKRYGYSDGSGVHRVLKRLQARSLVEPYLAQRLTNLKNKMRKLCCK